MLAALVVAMSMPIPEIGPHLRTEEPRIAALIEKGITRSPTFASLIAALKQTDVIVYVEPRLLEGVRGQLSHTVTVAGPFRYVRVHLMTTGSDDQMISTLAHEVQHAIEIAQAPDVGRSESVERYFRRIGFQRRLTYETDAAINVGQNVRDELGRRRMPRMDDVETRTGAAHVDVAVAVDSPASDQR